MGLTAQQNESAAPLMIHLVDGLLKEIERIAREMARAESELERLSKKVGILEAELAKVRSSNPETQDGHSGSRIFPRWPGLRVGFRGVRNTVHRL